MVVRHDMVHAAHEIFSYGSAATVATLNAGGPNSRPHTLLGICGRAGRLTNPVYSYDAHGNITSVVSVSAGVVRTHEWTSFDNPAKLSIAPAQLQTSGAPGCPSASTSPIRSNLAQNTAQVSFLYGSDHQRMREVSGQTKASPNGPITTQKTLSVLHPDNAGALYFERETINSGTGAGTAENRHYLTAEKGAFLLITSSAALQANPTATTLANAQQRYWHKDHLGSIVASTLLTATSTVGMVIERMAYEPFGKRRFISGQFDPTGSVDATSTTRGFTGHEHLDSLDFIHMNARVYDPDIGRFLSPDPTVPYVHNPQSFNRYSYTQNNPLNRVDPDGFRDSTNKQQVAEVIARMAAENGKTVGSKGPNANTGVHEAQTSNNPLNDNSGQAVEAKPDNVYTQNMQEAKMALGWYESAVEFGMTPGAAGKGVALGMGAMMGAKAGGLWGKATEAWGALKGKLGFGAKAEEKAVKAAAVETNAVKAAASVTISAQKQAGHILGTPQHTNRVKQGNPTSTFPNKKTADQLTLEAYEKGTAVPGRPGVRDYDFGHPVGQSPDGKSTQSTVRTHEDDIGRVHGHPSGPSTPAADPTKTD